MGLADILRNGVATANRLTAGLQTSVLHQAWIGQDRFGVPTYAAAIERPAIVEFRQRLRKGFNGAEVMQHATILFLEPIAPNYASGRREPIDPRDKITLPSGYTGPIIDISGVIDPAPTGVDLPSPYALEIALG
jgi:hypothetical protein